MSNFIDWTLVKLESRFGLEQVTTLSSLSEWMETQHPILPFEEGMLVYLQTLLRANVYGWNEQELSLNFIGPMMSLVNFTTAQTNFFAGRDIEGIVDGEQMRGKPDGIIASGRKEPLAPYFCFQEYKRNVDPNGDPYGQCLAAMLVAQEINHHQHPVYGVVVVGQQWNFMVLQETQYAISHGFIALDDDLFQIFRMLKSLKEKAIGFAAAAKPGPAHS